MNNYNCCTIYISDLLTNEDPYRPLSIIDEDFMIEFLDGINISADQASIKIKANTKNGIPYSFAIIKFNTHMQAVHAFKELNYSTFDRIPIRIIFWDQETKNIIRSKKGCIIINNLNKDIQVSQLDDSFSNFGEVIYCEVPYDVGQTENHKNRLISHGYGIVQFRHPVDAQAAIDELKGASINGTLVNVQKFTKHQTNTLEPVDICYIENFPKSYTDFELKLLFSQYGTVKTCQVELDENKESKQIGFCSMESPFDIARAIEGLNGLTIENLTLRCYYSKNRKDIIKRLDISQIYGEYKGRNVYVRNLDENVDESQLEKIFSKFGKVEMVKIVRNIDGKSKKFGFVCFNTPEEAKKCVNESNQIMIGDKRVYVSFKESREDYYKKQQQRKK